MRVLDDEPFLVLHPASRQGWRLRAAGVADNLQLQVLFADLVVPLSSWWRRRKLGKRPPAAVASVFWGRGPQSIEDWWGKEWELYQWMAVDRSGQLPAKVDHDDWIWSEGVPADIAPFDGLRVVLLAPVAHEVKWKVSRSFDSLRPELEISERLRGSDVDDWMRRFASTEHPPRVPVEIADDDIHCSDPALKAQLLAALRRKPPR